jgi:hypothetical protein
VPAISQRRVRLPPVLLASFGRETEEAALVNLLADPSHAVITLTGPAEPEKTRLAVEVARGARNQVFDGDAVWFAALADLLDGRFLPGALENALGIERAADPRPTRWRGSPRVCPSRRARCSCWTTSSNWSKGRHGHRRRTAGARADALPVWSRRGKNCC